MQNRTLLGPVHIEDKYYQSRINDQIKDFKSAASFRLREHGDVVYVGVVKMMIYPQVLPSLILS